MDKRARARLARAENERLKYEAYRAECIRLHDLKPAQARFEIAACNGALDKVEAFLKSGEIDVNHDGSLYTPLQYAVMRGHAKVAQLLLEHGADVSSVSRNGWTVLHLAIGQNHTKARDAETIVRALLLYGSDVNARGRYGRTPLQCAVQDGQSSHLVQILLDHGADISKTNDRGLNALHSLCLRHGTASVRARICTILLHHGTDFRSKLNDLRCYSLPPDDVDTDDSDTEDTTHTPGELADLFDLHDLQRLMVAAEWTCLQKVTQVDLANNAKRSAKAEQVRKQRVAAFAMGLHSRLGEQSGVLSLGPDIVGMISKLL
jgi:hypothetical protein